MISAETRKKEYLRAALDEQIAEKQSTSLMGRRYDMLQEQRRMQVAHTRAAPPTPPPCARRPVPAPHELASVSFVPCVPVHTGGLAAVPGGDYLRHGAAAECLQAALPCVGQAARPQHADQAGFGFVLERNGSVERNATPVFERHRVLCVLAGSSNTSVQCTTVFVWNPSAPDSNIPAL